MIKYFSFVIVISLWSLSINAQSFCQTPALRQPSDNKVTTLPSRSSSDSQYVLKVYFHVLRSSNGTDGVNSSIVQSAYNLLNDDFNTDNIYFLWDGIVDYIDNSSIYTNPSSSIFSYNNHQDGIDIYIYPTSVGVGGMANGYGSGTELYLTGNYNGISYAATHVVSHEMGHVLNLYHTHHGTCSETGGDPNQCAELVNGVNSDVCGDYIGDTPADPGIFQNVTSSCVWIYQGTYFDSNNQAYNPDTHLIMSYTKPDCMEYFSPMQVQRMKGAIDNFPVLQNTVITITGASLLYNSATYSITNLQSAFSAEWSLTGANASNFTIQNNYPSTNQCTITRNANSTFSGSTSLILSAQIKYNGTTVHTITKNLVAPYISGTSIPCNTENYHVKDLPGNTNVSWSVSGLGLTGTQLHPGYLIEDSINSYYVSRTAQGYARGTVSATVQTSENTTATLTKRIDTGGNFTGTWYQIPSTLNPDTSNSSPAALQSGGMYILNKSQSTVLQSSDFIDASITTNCNGMTLLSWSNPNNGTITFIPTKWGTGNNIGSAIVEGWKSSTCETFRLNFSCIFTDPIFTLGVSASGQDYIFTLQNKQTDENGNERTQPIESVDQPWKLSVVQYDTGLTVYENSVSGTSMTVNASRWKPGIYIVIATIGDDMCVQKITVK